MSEPAKRKDDRDIIVDEKGKKTKLGDKDGGRSAQGGEKKKESKSRKKPDEPSTCPDSFLM